MNSTTSILLLALAGLAPVILSALVTPQLAVAVCLPIQAVVAWTLAYRGLSGTPGVLPCYVARRPDGRQVYLPTFARQSYRR